MSTANLLTQSVMIAGEKVTPIIGKLEEYAEQIAGTDFDLLTRDEQAIRMISEAAKVSMPLINLRTAISVAGVGSDGFPRLGVAHYDMSIRGNKVFARVEGAGSVSFLENDWGGWHRNFVYGTLPPVKILGFFAPSRTKSTSVPLVPLGLRQADTGDKLVLFEVEEWNYDVLRSVDPLLLQLIAGDVCAILGTWDLTQKEIDIIQASRDLGI